MTYAFKVVSIISQFIKYCKITTFHQNSLGAVFVSFTPNIRKMEFNGNYDSFNLISYIFIAIQQQKLSEYY